MRGVVLESSRNTRDESRGQYIFKGVKDAKHTAAFIIAVLALDHIGGASSRYVCLMFAFVVAHNCMSLVTHTRIYLLLSFNGDWSKYLPGTRPPDAAQGIEDEEPGAPSEEETRTSTCLSCCCCLICLSLYMPYLTQSLLAFLLRNVISR